MKARLTRFSIYPGVYGALLGFILPLKGVSQLTATPAASAASPPPATVAATVAAPLDGFEVVAAKPDPAVVTDAAARQQITALGKPWKIRHTQSGIVLVLIPPGEFTMGSPSSETLRGSDEVSHRCRLTQPFYVGLTEVSQAQWRRVMTNNPSQFEAQAHPVENVTWIDCQTFLRNAGAGLRLPTEAEWEYACRAGSTDTFSFGATLSPRQVNFDGNFPYGGAPTGPSRATPVACGSLPANAWGLHEMHGNVLEWCHESPGDYGTGLAIDPIRLASGSFRIVRGGGWNDGAVYCRAAYRDSLSPSHRANNTGFRVVLPLNPK